MISNIIKAVVLASIAMPSIATVVNAENIYHCRDSSGRFTSCNKKPYTPPEPVSHTKSNCTPDGWCTVGPIEEYFDGVWGSWRKTLNTKWFQHKIESYKHKYSLPYAIDKAWSAQQNGQFINIWSDGNPLSPSETKKFSNQINKCASGIPDPFKGVADLTVYKLDNFRVSVHDSDSDRYDKGWPKFVTKYVSDDNKLDYESYSIEIRYVKPGENFKVISTCSMDINGKLLDDKSGSQRFVRNDINIPLTIN